MKAAGLTGVSWPRSTRTTIRDDRVRPASNLVDRNFLAQQPNALRMADVTYLPSWAGVLYLTIVLDAYRYRIVGWAMGHNLKAQLVIDAMNMAIGQRKPNNVVHHSDQDRNVGGLRPALQRSRRASIDGLGR